ncbi:aldose epimerase family protein [uncultured Maritalea sp.]|jgi:aldose 1-epimerase|uniref:aldose epimerase family protein n=1 Tax=uncultured Maritalea sp. TaxID=757249 RepID=UPI0026236F08|nr:aldose epimerase family protein [uncultured Maritalea sp.]
MNAIVTRLGEIDGKPFDRIVLKTEQAEVAVLSLGGITQSWVIPTPNGPLDVVLGYDDPFDYIDNPDYLGTTVGRVANRISGAQFELDGEIYPLSQNGPGMTLHGGTNGLSKRNWTVVDVGETYVELTYTSAHLEEGFPGNVEFTMLITLEGARLNYHIGATVDRPTPINFAQHNYYNLLGGGPIWDHQMQISATHYAPLGDDLLPTGEIASIAGTPFDYRTLRSFAEADPNRKGMDMAYVLPADRDLDDPVAQVKAPNGVTLQLWTDQPCLQTYNGNNQSVQTSGASGRPFGRCSAICIEPQRHSNAVNTPAFPSIIVTPEMPYAYRTAIEIQSTSA